MSALPTNLQKILSTGLESVSPKKIFSDNVFCAESQLSLGERLFHLKDYQNIYVVGFGKASAAMAIELEHKVGSFITEGIVVTKYGHSYQTKKIVVYEAGHPIVDERSLFATERIVSLVNKAKEDDLVICLISGGGSALLECLPTEISLQDLQSASEVLIRSGATIQEINAVRQRISMVKGGKLGELIYPATCLNVIISDIMGDPVDLIASGATVPSKNSSADALKILEKYSLTAKFPESIVDYLEAQSKSQNADKKAKTLPSDINTFIIGNNRIALEAAKKEAEKMGFETNVFSESLYGDANRKGKEIISMVGEEHTLTKKTEKPVCMIFGGETTVEVNGDGRGGRNQQLVLSALVHLPQKCRDFIFLSCGTDGTDGPTDAAGAFLSKEIIKKTDDLGLKPKEYLDNNDAYNFFYQCGGLIITGVTGTNVMDIAILIVW